MIKIPLIKNIGAGAGEIFKQETASNENELRTVKAGSNITVTNNTNDVEIANSKPENTTVANVGTGAGQVYRDKTTDQINLKTIKAGSNITVTNNADDVTLAATGGVSSMTWEDTLAFDGAIWERVVPYDTWVGNPSIYLGGYKTGGTGGSSRFSFWNLLHSGYAGGDISARLMAWAYFGSSGTHTYTIRGRYLANGDNYDVAFSASTTLTMGASGTLCRFIICPWTVISLDGTYGADKGIMGKIERSDSESDDPVITILKLKYTINL